MNTGQIITSALQRAKLPVNNYSMRSVARDLLNEVIQEIWSYQSWNFTKFKASFATANGVEEYALHKLYTEMVPNTMRGTNPIRRIRFEMSHDFYKKRPFTLQSLDPYFYRDGESRGVQIQPSAASPITFYSNLNNFSTGTVNALYGRAQLLFSNVGVSSIDFIGRSVRIGTDEARYKIIKVYPSNGSGYPVDIDRPYEGVTNPTASFVIGDVSQKAIAQGLDVNGSYLEEEVQLNGENQVSTTNSFSSLARISKSDKTYGSIFATSNSGTITNVILDPAETEVDYRTIKFYPIPVKTETIEYEAYLRHPILYKNSDVCLIPGQFHFLVMLKLQIKLMTDFLLKDVPQKMLIAEENGMTALMSYDNRFYDWHAVTEDEYSNWLINTNLPTTFGSDDGFYGI